MISQYPQGRLLHDFLVGRDVDMPDDDGNWPMSSIGNRHRIPAQTASPIAVRLAAIPISHHPRSPTIAADAKIKTAWQRGETCGPGPVF